MSNDKELKDIENKNRKLAISNIRQNGSQIKFEIDFEKLKSKEKKQLLSTLGEMKPDFKKVSASWDKMSEDKNARLFQANASVMTSSPFEASFFEGSSSSFTMSTNEKIMLAMRIFKTEPLVGKTIELMKIFSNDGFKNEHGNRKIKKFYDNWNSMVSFDQVLGWLFLEYYRSGNVVTWREMVQFRENMFKGGSPMLYSDASFEAMAARKIDWTKQLIPGAYTVLNPLTVRVDRANGYNDSLFYNGPLTDNEYVEGPYPDDPTRLLVRQLPHELEDRMSATKDFKNIPLNKKCIRRILRMRMPYESYGNILMERAFAPVHEKNKLRQMDLSMTNSLIAQIVTVTIGSDEFPATPKQLKNITEAFRNVGKSQVLVWNHTLKVEVIRPDTKVLNKEKYARIDEDIRNAFGISQVLTGGGDMKTNFATAYLSLKAFLSNLIEGREDILRWVKQEYRDIAEAMQFDSYPVPSFNPLSLTDEVAEKQILMQLVDRKIISYESAQVRLGFDSETEIERMKHEKPMIEDGTLGTIGSPYQQGNGDDKLSGGKDDIASKKEKDKLLKQQKNKMADTKETSELIQERKHGTSVPDPSKVAGNPAPKPKKSGDSGRPKTPKGTANYPESRKPHVMGQAELEESEGVEEPSSVIDRAKDILGK